VVVVLPPCRRCATKCYNEGWGVVSESYGGQLTVPTIDRAILIAD
jgi:hypothetical protein